MTINTVTVLSTTNAITKKIFLICTTDILITLVIRLGFAVLYIFITILISMFVCMMHHMHTVTPYIT